jgi:hypothetical protein
MEYKTNYAEPLNRTDLCYSSCGLPDLFDNPVGYLKSFIALSAYMKNKPVAVSEKVRAEIERD